MLLEKLRSFISAEESVDQTPKAGILCPYTVEEIVHAAGFLPVRIIPERLSFDIADAYLPTNTCSFLRHVVEMGVRGDLKDMECIIVNHSCDAARRVYDLLTTYMQRPRIYFQDIPKKCDVDSRVYFTHILRGLQLFLQNVAGMEITKESLQASVKVYNRNRKLLCELYSLRAARPDILNSALMMQVIAENSRNPKLLMNKVIASFISEVKGMGTGGETGITGKRVYVSGGLIDPLPLISYIEEAGGVVVGDDFCFGGRYCEIDVDEDEAPIDALAKRYLERIPCGRMERSTERFRYIIEKMNQFRAGGLIYVSLKFCDNFLVDYHLFKKILDTEGIPSLFLEGEYSATGSGQLRTRIEGFVEML